MEQLKSALILKGYSENDALLRAYTTIQYVRTFSFSILIYIVLLFLGYTYEPLLAFAFAKFYRNSVGGLHVRNHFLCFFLTFSMIFIILILSNITFSWYIYLICYTFILFVWYKYVPKGTEIIPLRDVVVFNKLRIISLIKILFLGLLYLYAENLFSYGIWAYTLISFILLPTTYAFFNIKEDRM